ncbi:MAG: hypothetical protein RBT75_17020 [Anaerolineae bacterium]|jgi:hypothetical protein|nr:hypothetical protein [Anaerolineae bacterium]
MKQLPLYEILEVKSDVMPEVWILAEQYPYLTVKWHPRARPEVDVELLRLRYDANGEVQAALRTIGKQQGITAEMIRRRLKRITAWLSKQLSR